MELKSNEEKITQALLVSVDTGDFDAEASLAELFELVKVPLLRKLLYMNLYYRFLFFLNIPL